MEEFLNNYIEMIIEEYEEENDVELDLSSLDKKEIVEDAENYDYIWNLLDEFIRNKLDEYNDELDDEYVEGMI